MLSPVWRRPLGRRVVLAAAAQLCIANPVMAEAEPEHLEYRDGRLDWPGGGARAAEGRGGVRLRKQEGDGATPAGVFPLVALLYRKDRMAPPRCRLPTTPLEPDHGWVDEPADPNYNRLVSLPYAGRTEAMWRLDDLYDLVVVIGYNTNPAAPGAGSAIFLHIARADFAKTEGCIAVERQVLLDLLPLLAQGSTITIRPPGP